MDEARRICDLPWGVQDHELPSPGADELQERLGRVRGADSRGRADLDGAGALRCGRRANLPARRHSQLVALVRRRVWDVHRCRCDYPYGVNAAYRAVRWAEAIWR